RSNRKAAGPESAAPGPAAGSTPARCARSPGCGRQPSCTGRRSNAGTSPASRSGLGVTQEAPGADVGRLRLARLRAVLPDHERLEADDLVLRAARPLVIAEDPFQQRLVVGGPVRDAQRVVAPKRVVA